MLLLFYLLFKNSNISNKCFSDFPVFIFVVLKVFVFCGSLFCSLTLSTGAVEYTDCISAEG